MRSAGGVDESWAAFVLDAFANDAVGVLTYFALLAAPPADVAERVALMMDAAAVVYGGGASGRDGLSPEGLTVMFEAAGAALEMLELAPGLSTEEVEDMVLSVFVSNDGTMRCSLHAFEAYGCVFLCVLPCAPLCLHACVHACLFLYVGACECAGLCCNLPMYYRWQACNGHAATLCGVFHEDVRVACIVCLSLSARTACCVAPGRRLARWKWLCGSTAATLLDRTLT